MSIPKIIHYCWFGGNEKPEIVKKCIESWKKYMPDYEIKEWNESNYDCLKNRYIKEAYNSKKWAFVSDYARFDILYLYGGIYFDTDVELLKSIPHEILANKAFTCTEPTGKVNPGLIFACEKNNFIAKKMIDTYNQDSFLDDKKNPICKTVNAYITEILYRYGYEEKNKLQKVNDLVIYPSEYFCGFDLDIMEKDITQNTISVHHYSGTWIKQGLKQKIQKIIKRKFGIKFYRKLLMILRKVKR